MAINDSETVRRMGIAASITAGVELKVFPADLDEDIAKAAAIYRGYALRLNETPPTSEARKSPAGFERTALNAMMVGGNVISLTTELIDGRYAGLDKFNRALKDIEEFDALLVG